MARKKANYPLVEGLEITTLAAEGKAMGRWNDVVVFVLPVMACRINSAWLMW